MNRCQLSILPTVCLTIVGMLATSNNTQAQSPGYQMPNYYGATQAGGGQHRPAPPYPASPLAGGSSAARGDAFMDAHGRPIIMPANYCQSCPSGGYGPGAPGSNGDPMAVDFGGYGQQDQCGPHYFDVAFETVFLKSDDLAGAGLPAFSSVGLGSAPGQTDFPLLDPNGKSEDYEPGWKVAIRYDIGPLSLLEATYMGLYDFGFNQSVFSADVAPGGQTDQLFSIFSNYGFLDIPPADGNQGITGLDEASEHRLSYQSDLQSTEFTYRRYWVGNRPRISGTMLAGFRYVRMTEDFSFSAVTENGNGFIGYSTENDLLGGQFGGDGWISLRQGLRIGGEGKVGIYNNRFKYNAAFANTPTPANLTAPAEGNQVAFVGEGDFSIVFDLFPSWSVRAGYEVLYLNSLVSLQGNIDTTIYDPAASAQALATQGNALYHGFHGGVEYVW